MKRTQIQLPDPLYEKVKQIAEQLDWSVAEVLRRGAEYMVSCHDRGDGVAKQEWRPPSPRRYGAFVAPVEEWRELASQR